MVYIDTMILIYLLEGNPIFFQSIASEMTRLESQGHNFISSVLALTEYLAGTEEIDTSATSQIQNLSFIPVDAEIARLAGASQRRYGLKIGDSVHLATSIEQGCELFFTNDNKLARAAAHHGKVLRPAAA